MRVEAIEPSERAHALRHHAVFGSTVVRGAGMLAGTTDPLVGNATPPAAPERGSQGAPPGGVRGFEDKQTLAQRAVTGLGKSGTWALPPGSPRRIRPGPNQRLGIIRQWQHGGLMKPNQFRWIRLTTTAVAFLLLGVAPHCPAQCPADFIFAPANTFAVSPSYTSGAVRDFNGDGAMDAVFLAQGYGSLDAYFGIPGSSGATGALVGPSLILGGSNFNAVGAGDFNSDGIPDVAVCTNSGVIVLPGRQTSPGAGAFGPPVQSGGLYDGTPYKAVAADLNDDGIGDLILFGGFTGGAVVVLFGDGTPPLGNGRFLPGGTLSVGSGVGSYGGAVADLNGDGIADIVAAKSTDPGLVSVFIGHGVNGAGDGTFDPPVDLPAGPGSYDVVAADLNGDGRADIAVTNHAQIGSISVLANRAAGTFGAGSFSPPIIFPAGGNPTRLVTADLNGDGHPDLLAASQDGVSVLLGAEPSVNHEVLLSPPFFAAPIAGFADVEAGDLNGDGRVDAIGTGTVVLGPGNYYRSLSTLLNDCVPPAEAAPQLLPVKDVPLDQGGRVSVSWLPSAYDRTTDARVNEYWVWRSIPTSTASLALASGSARIVNEQEPLPGNRVRLFRSRSTAGEDSFWEFVAREPASALPGYSFIAQTPYDSTAQANPLTAFFVQARTSDGLHWFDSSVSSGYSVDNLAPDMPSGFGGIYFAGATHLHWGPSGAKDLAGYRLYRCPVADFVPGPGNLAASTTDTSFVDLGMPGSYYNSYYKLGAVDIHGNQSELASLSPAQVSGADQMGVPPVAFLSQNHPNPFNPQTGIEFGLHEAGRVTLRVYSPAGRMVRTLVNESRPAGTYSVPWDGRDDRGRNLPSGVYVARLESAGAFRAIKMVLTR